jgi:hypothetical protein
MLVIVNVKATPKDISAWDDPVFPKIKGTRIIGTNARSRNSPKIRIASANESMLELFMMYCNTGASGSKSSTRSPR